MGEELFRIYNKQPLKLNAPGLALLLGRTKNSTFDHNQLSNSAKAAKIIQLVKKCIEKTNEFTKTQKDAAQLQQLLSNRPQKPHSQLNQHSLLNQGPVILNQGTAIAIGEVTMPSLQPTNSLDELTMMLSSLKIETKEVNPKKMEQEKEIYKTYKN